MEIAGAVVQLVDCLSPSICRRWKEHRNIYENMETLKQKLEELNCRKRDIESRAATEIIYGRTTLKNEVKNWMECVEKIGEELHSIEEKVRTVEFLSRARLGKKVSQKIAEVEELHRKGIFPDGLVMSLPNRGDLLPTIGALGGESFKRKVGEILACVLDDEVTKVGVYGMGGIGKTTALEHINNRLVKDHKEKFKNVIWVTVSKDSNVMNLQDRIASKLNPKIFSGDDDQRTRAARLYEEFSSRKSYVLILDDLWDPYYLQDIGIPEPTAENKCKLILTTRSHEVCRRMSCKPIPMELLSNEEALNLFLDTVGPEILAVQNLQSIVEKVAQECAGLPLAIVTIAGSLKGVVSRDEWEIALEDLVESTKGPTSDGIFERLKFSYDRLNDRKLQECLLYCALYPEDYQIERKLLIEHLVVEEIVEERKTRQSEIQKGQVMLNKLVDVCLLNNTLDSSGKKCVKMHDLIRDMALQITSGQAPLFMGKAGIRLRAIPDEENWKRDLVRASLMNNDICDISSCIQPPNCPRLLTLFISGNNYLRSISGHFFLHMKRLSVLDLSYTRIGFLPESLFDLVNLTALFLRGCSNLRLVPSLANLREMRKLDFFEAGIIEVPQGMELLIKLRYLNFYKCPLKIIPYGILCKLSNLQYLSFSHPVGGEKINEEELACLRKIETFEVELHDIENLNACVRILRDLRAASYILHLGSIYKLWKEPDHANSFVDLVNFHLLGSVAAGAGLPLLFPKDIEVLRIENCAIYVRDLCELPSFNNVTNLRRCIVSRSCFEMEDLFSYSESIFLLLQSLETLVLTKLPNLRGLIRREKGRPSPLPAGAFSSLIKLSISGCNKMKKVFMITFLPNLEELYLDGCKQLKEIISTASDDDEEEDEDDTVKQGADCNAIKIITLPKLRVCKLSKLPELWSLPLVADSLQEISLQDCPKLRRLPMLDRPSPPPSLQCVSIHDPMWKALKWDHPSAKKFIQSLTRTSGR